MNGSGNASLKVRRKKIRIQGDSSRVVTRFHMPSTTERACRIIRRVLNLTDAAAVEFLSTILLEFSERHKDIKGIFNLHYGKITGLLPAGEHVSQTKQLLIGAYFTMEYSIESAALFNPSIVEHQDQSSVDSGCLRFIMSLRATGEGHISSLVFRSGVLDRDNTVLFDPISNYVERQHVWVNPQYDRYLFQLKLNEMGACNEVTTYVLERLPLTFAYSELRKQLETLREFPVFARSRQDETVEIMFWLANSNYTMNFTPDDPICEKVIFPVSENESCGIEDARFVRFYDDNGESTYYATYTAYNGVTILPQLIETKDFNTFKVMTLNGKAVQNKGMALFPRKINGKYVMLSRQDNENNHLMVSDNIHFWQETEIIQEPQEPWEFFQIGNCGSPLETEQGWIVLTHGVGPMRQYCIGAMLLDREDPRRIIGRLREPLLAPNEGEREGYVPNVLYSCGAILHHDEIVIPFAMSDCMSGIATVNTHELIERMIAGNLS